MNRTPLPRPTLIPGLPRFWRNPGELQIGLDPAHAVLLQLPDPRAAGVLDLLDGGSPERLILLRAAELGIPAGDAHTLIELLRAAGLVLPAGSLLPAALPAAARHRLTCEAAALALSSAGRPGQPRDPSPARVLRQRLAARVVVSGRGRLGATIAVALAQAGVGHVHPDLSGVVGPAELTGSPLVPADVGTPRRSAVEAAILRVAPGTAVHPVRRTPASLVIQLAHDEPAALVAAGHASRRQPHLAVAVRDGVAVIGPLVPATGAPCLNCLDLHRRERDEGWSGGPAPTAMDSPEPSTVAVLLAATAYAAGEALTFLDGAAPETLGAAVEISAPGRFRRRTWPPHPRCGCHRRRRGPTFTGPSPHNYQTTSRQAG
ncbi:thiamine biosynthesis protein ThiF [Actinoplanes utahensis]|uniref:thiamine biosynthesis protein ThiF n=1 Tax=Actinoplanes utahensis TaxID=1869 RepID=UPI0006922A66|nr:thiamine biosynthesis protein ThiF [Actinoplanes utahensis]